MKKLLIFCCAILLAISFLSACTNQDVGMTAGAVGGGVIGGALTHGSTVGTIAGAVGGGFVGRQLAN